MFSVKKILVISILALLLGMLTFLAWYREEAAYGLRQARGQLGILWNARPVEEFLQDSAFNPAYKQKLLLIQEIRQFTIDSLGLDESGSYRSLFDQQGKPILWVVTASPRFAMEPKRWSFPFFGSFPYKGHFEQERALQEAAQLEDSLDVHVGEVSAWSTLGVLNDPILSSMLERSEGGLAELVIHELTHGTLYVKDNIAYNENLADFVGEEGAIRFLRHKYGETSPQYQEYVNRKHDRLLFYRYVLQGAQRLDSLYRSFPTQLPVHEKQRLKDLLIDEIRTDIRLQPFRNEQYHHYFDTLVPNNTFFMSFKTYREQQNQFREQFEGEFKGNFKAYMRYLKETYPSMF